MKSYLLPVLAVLAWIGGVFTVPPVAASSSAPVIPVAANQSIYAGALQNGWQYLGWGNVNLSNPSPALSVSSIKAQEGAWQAINLHHAALQTTPKMTLTFWVNGGSIGNQLLVVRALRHGVAQAPVTLYTLKPNVWHQVIISLPNLGVGSVKDLDGIWIQNNSAKTLAPFYVDKIALTGAGASVSPAPVPPAPVPPAPVPPAPVPPAPITSTTPSGLTVTPLWAASCPVCGGMAMAHMVLAWNAVSGATAYTVYRNGVKLPSQAAPGWTDMGVTSGQTYSYAVSATSPGGESMLSASVSAVAPAPPANAAVLTAPVNLAVQGSWQGSGATDTLAWTAVFAAASYNVYQYGTLIGKGVQGTTYSVPVSAWCAGMTYSVTAVDSMGMESLPSAIVTAQGMQDPAQSPSWAPSLPVVPTALRAVSEWNGGMPRIHLAWNGNGANYTYAVYRNGKLAASGLWGLNFYDTAVNAGQTYTYTVSSVNVPWTQAVESMQSLPVSAAGLTAAPASQGGAVEITNVQPNDDGAVVSFDAVPGAMDYRIYDVAKPASVKYSGGSLSVEMNGLDPAAGADLIVEAVDKLGPFQTMDGMAGPGAMQMDGMHSAINGQGDPSNIPGILAASAPFHVSCAARSLTGGQAFFDTFRGEQPLALQPLPAVPYADFYGRQGQYAEYDNDKWAIRNYGGDIADSAVFFMGNHFMDTLYDGGTPHTNEPLHNNNASLVMMPKAAADISGGKVLHVTFEVDPHMDSRRWCDVFVGAAGDTLVDPGKFADFPNRRPTMSGQLFRWEIQSGMHALSVFPGTQTDAQSDVVHLTNQANGVGPDNFGLCARTGPWCAIPFNGTPDDLDKRHKFDLYLSKNRAVIMEQGHVVKDASFPAGVTLPFDRCQVYFVHQLYHTGNDRPELMDYDPSDSYWCNNRPWSDERHWDNMGQEVLNAFPTLP